MTDRIPHKRELIVSEDRIRSGRANGGHGGTEGFAPDLIETIGVYAEGGIQSILEPLEKGEFRCEFHSTLSSLHCWILSTRPKLVILESSILLKADSQELKNLKETLSRWGILSLIVVNSVEEIKQWRNAGWPQGGCRPQGGCWSPGGWPGLHFCCGPVTKRSLKDKITRMLAERLLLERPGVGVLSDKPYLLSHLEMVLRYYGIRIIPVKAGEMNEALECLASEPIDALLLDVDAFDGKATQFLENLVKETTLPESIPSFLVSETKGSPMVYSTDRFNELCFEILETVKQNREMRLTVLCDHRTGLYLPETFLHLSEREMALASRRGEEFSIVKIQFRDVQAIEEKFGPIFARELELVLGFFIEHRVRLSDFVAKGFHHGQLLVLFPGVGRQTAHLVGERLRVSFGKAASFGNASRDGFSPRLEYEIYCYPHDVKQIDELEKMLKMNPEEAGMAPPVRANLAEEL